MTPLASTGWLILRAVFGLVMAAHGAQKLFGWWGGPGMAKRVERTAAMGIRPAAPFAWVNALGEFLGGLGVAAGLLTPLAAAGPLGSMIVAAGTVHAPKGFWNHEGGFEYPAVLGTIAAVLMLIGPGAWSLDAALGLRYREPATGLVLIVVTAVVSAIALAGRARSLRQRP